MSPGHGQVSESLDGLVGALDSLKRTLGYGDEFALVEQHLGDLRKENRELRAYAEQAIRVRARCGRCGPAACCSAPCRQGHGDAARAAPAHTPPHAASQEAQRLKELNENLESQAQHQQLEGQMGAALNETAKLIGVADGFERVRAAPGSGPPWRRPGARLPLLYTSTLCPRAAAACLPFPPPPAGQDVYEGRLAEAHAQLRDQQEMQRRLDELEEENQGGQHARLLLLLRWELRVLRAARGVGRAARGACACDATDAGRPGARSAPLRSSCVQR
jgi:hypothetical protein